jgi:hypothetical protein
MGELFRRAVFADRYESEEDKITLALIEQVNASTKRANAALDEAFKRIEASEKRNKALNARLI